VRDFRETFIEIMRNPEWASHFDLTSRPNFDVTGRRVIGPACSALWWERKEEKRRASNAIGSAAASGAVQCDALLLLAPRSLPMSQPYKSSRT
jgi:hypothetical protein